MSERHLLDLSDVGPSGIATLLELAVAPPSPALEGVSTAMVFEKPSARTRSSTELAVVDLGGYAMMIADGEVGIDRRESAEDVARTLGSFHRIIAARVNDHGVLVRMRDVLDDFAKPVSVVNLLSDVSHPCQALADVLTLADEHGGIKDIDALRGLTATYVGDANNVTWSLAQAMLSVGVNVRVASPEGYQLSDADVAALVPFGSASGATLERFDDPSAAAVGAHALYTDVWTSMGQEHEVEQRRIDLKDFQIDEAMIALGAPDVIVMHCLPAHRGEEISSGALEGSASRVWTQVEHRRTAMRGVLRWVIGESS